MAHEEAHLARLEVARGEMEASAAARHERYAAEDAATSAVRAHDETLYNEGVKVREEMKTRLEAAIAARGETPEQLAARVAHLEAMLAEKSVEPPQPASEPSVTQPAA